VLKEARTETGGLKVEQKDALRRAEKKLNTAAEAVDYKTTELKYKSRASDRRVLETKIDSTDYDDSESELARMRAEIESLRHEMEAKRAKEQVAARAHEMEVSEKELAELEIMIKEYETAESKRQVKAGEHDEMKIELEKLRSRVKEIEAEEQPDTGSLTYEIPPRQTLPLPQCRLETLKALKVLLLCHQRKRLLTTTSHVTTLPQALTLTLRCHTASLNHLGGKTPHKN